MPTEADRHLTGAFLKGMPAHAARALEGLEPAAIATCLEAYDAASVAPAAAAMRAGTLLAALRLMPQDRAGAILVAMDHAAAASVLRLADEDTRAALMQGLTSRKVTMLRRVAGYPLDVAGAWCEPQAPVFSSTAAAGEIADAVRKTPEGPQDPIILADGAGQFVACISITDVMSAHLKKPVNKLARQKVSPILDTTRITDANVHTGWLDFPLLPVIDIRGRIVGVLSRRRLFDALNQIDIPAIERADADTDLLTNVVSATTGWLGVMLEALIVRQTAPASMKVKSRAKHGAGAGPPKKP